MFGRILRARGIIPVILILAALIYWWLRPRPLNVIAIEYVAYSNVPLWNALALGRQRVADLHYGERIEVVRQEGTAVQVRTPSGSLGWLPDTRQLMDSDLWEQSAAMLTRARAMPVQARGQTKTVSNVRIEPGRNGKRIFQFTRGTPVLVLDRTVADAPQSNEDSAVGEKDAGSEDQKPKQEDWLFVLRTESLAPASGEPASGASPPAPASRASAGPVSGGLRGQALDSLAANSYLAPPSALRLGRFIYPERSRPPRRYRH